MKKFKAFLKGEKPSKDQEARSDLGGASTPSQPDQFGIAISLQLPHPPAPSTSNSKTTTNSASSRFAAPGLTSTVAQPETNRTPGLIRRDHGLERANGQRFNTPTSQSITPASAPSIARSPADRTPSPRRRAYEVLPGGQIASSPIPSRPGTLQSTEERKVSKPGTYGTSPGGRIGRISALAAPPRVQPQLQRSAVGGKEAAATSSGKSTKKMEAEESDSDDSDMDDLMAMMIAASMASRSGAAGGLAGSSHGQPGIEALLLAAMLAKGRQKREDEKKTQGEKKDEEKEKAVTTETGTTSRTGASQIETFAEWRARRAREEQSEERKAREERRAKHSEAARGTQRERDQRDESDIDSTLPFSVRLRLLRERRERREREERGEIDTPSGNTTLGVNTSVSTSKEAGKTEESLRPKSGPNFKVKPLQKAAPSAPAAPVPDQSGRRIVEKTLRAPAAEEKAPAVTPTPTPVKRKGPVFKVPPLSAAQRAALPIRSGVAFRRLGSAGSTSLVGCHIVFDRVYTEKIGKIPERILKFTGSRVLDSCEEKGVCKGKVLWHWQTKEGFWLWREVLEEKSY